MLMVLCFKGLPTSRLCLASFWLLNDAPIEGGDILDGLFLPGLLFQGLVHHTSIFVPLQWLPRTYQPHTGFLAQGFDGF